MQPLPLWIKIGKYFWQEEKDLAGGGLHLPHADSAIAKQGRICAAFEERSFAHNEALAFLETFPQLPKTPEKPVKRRKL